MNLLAITEMVSWSKLTLWQIHSLQLIKGDLPAQFTQKMLIIYFSVILKVTLNKFKLWDRFTYDHKKQI